ncbi:MAG: TonB-dependent receptor [Bacteroidales bacterium]|nr:TonB-dependent receptor [Candidatus Physcousia equi]
MRKLLLPLFVAALSAHADDSAQTDSTDFAMEQIVVTGTRTPKRLKDTPVQTIVITAQDIKKADASDVRELLQQELPGVEFSYAMSQQLHMNFSGFGGQGILFLVDGERLAGETMDDIDFTRLCMDNVDRIEIVKGAASALYGSNAGGGVINIISRNATDPFALNLNARYAPRHNGQRYGATLHLNNPRWHETLTANFRNQDNVSVKNAPNAVTRVISEIYGERSVDVKEQLAWTPNEQWRITGRAGFFFRSVPRSEDVPERYRDFTAGLRAQWHPTDEDNLEFSYSFDQYDKSDYQRIARLDIRDYSNVQNIFRTFYTHRFDSSMQLCTGADFMHDYLFNPNLEHQKRSQDSYDVFVQLDWNVHRDWELVGAVRFDHYSALKSSRLTPKLAVCYKGTPHLKLRASYGMGFRAPTLKEMFYNFDMMGIWTIRGNEHLRPEMSHNFTASAEWTKGNYCMTASTYYNRITNKLTTGIPYAVGKDVVLNYTNLKHYAVCGAELTALARWRGGWSARVAYAYVHEALPKDDAGDAICSPYLPARPHSLTARLEWEHQFHPNYRLSTMLNGRVLSGVSNIEYIDYYNLSKGVKNISYPAYTFWRLAITHHIGRQWRITTTFDNLFHYRPRHHYLNAPLTDGFNFLIGAEFTI